jgi:L-fuconolactonase
MKIDGHQHFWHYSPEEYGWIGPQMASLQQDHLPSDLVPLLETTGLDGTVAVQARQSLEETAWLLALSDRYSIIKGVVGWVDLCSPDAQAQLERFCAHPRFRGVRHVVQDEIDDRFMLRADFGRGIATLRNYGLAYDILIYPRHLAVAHEMVVQFPDQPFVLDHLAKPPIKDGQLSAWAQDIRRLADLPNVTCKVSGMVTEANWERWQPADLWPYLDLIFEAFGAQRIMFGSDWPVCKVAATYPQVVEIVSDYVDGLSEAEQAAVWGGTATDFYGLG